MQVDRRIDGRSGLDFWISSFALLVTACGSPTRDAGSNEACDCLFDAGKKSSDAGSDPSDGGGNPVPDAGQVTDSVRCAGAWSTIPTGTTANLHAVWGRASNDLWSVGANGTTIHWDGTAWSKAVSGTTNDLFGISGSTDTADDVWAVGTGGTIIRWSGSSWSSVPSGTQTDLDAVWVSRDGRDVWATSSN